MKTLVIALFIVVSSIFSTNSIISAERFNENQITTQNSTNDGLVYVRVYEDGAIWVYVYTEDGSFVGKYVEQSN